MNYIYWENEENPLEKIKQLKKDNPQAEIEIYMEISSLNKEMVDEIIKIADAEIYLKPNPKELNVKNVLNAAQVC